MDKIAIQLEEENKEKDGTILFIPKIWNTFHIVNMNWHKWARSGKHGISNQ